MQQAMKSTTHSAAPVTGWPSRPAAYYGLGVIVFATMLNFFDGTVFFMMVERIRVDFHLSDMQLGWLLGPANIIFYVLVGIPLARLVDIYPRKFVLAAGLFLTSSLTAMGGIVQGFKGLFATRMLAGAGGSAHAPGAYSLLADFFPPDRLPRAIAVLQLGFIGGTTLGAYVGGQLLGMVADWEPTQWRGLTIYGWQWVLIMVGSPGLLIVTALLLMREPPRQGVSGELKSLPIRVVAHEIWLRKRVYLPLFIGLAFSALESQGLAAWRVPLMVRSHGWDEARIGNWLAPLLLVTQLAGLYLGTMTTEWLGRKHKDAHVRTTTLMFSAAVPCAVLAPLVPWGELTLILYALAGMFGIGSAVPQNAAIQRITPNRMRGTVTAIYLFMFIFFGAMGSLLIGTVTQRIIGDPAGLWKAMALTAAALLPLAAFVISRGIRPYREEILRLEALEAGAAPGTEISPDEVLKTSP